MLIISPPGLASTLELWYRSGSYFFDQKMEDSSGEITVMDDLNHKVEIKSPDGGVLTFVSFDVAEGVNDVREKIEVLFALFNPTWVTFSAKMRTSDGPSQQVLLEDDVTGDAMGMIYNETGSHSEHEDFVLGACYREKFTFKFAELEEKIASATEDFNDKFFAFGHKVSRVGISVAGKRHTVDINGLSGAVGVFRVRAEAFDIHPEDDVEISLISGPIFEWEFKDWNEFTQHREGFILEMHKRSQGQIPFSIKACSREGGDVESKVRTVSEAVSAVLMFFQQVSS